MIEEGPLKYAIENPPEGVIRQKLVTLFVRDGVLVEETAEREYYPKGDYNDSVTTVPLIYVRGSN